jgi:signal transduction histidine kinase
MKISRENKKLLHIAIIALGSILISFLLLFFIISKIEKRLIEERKNDCVITAREISKVIENSNSLDLICTLYGNEFLSLDSSRIIDKYFSELVEETLTELNGLEGGIYVKGLGDFVGYAFPTSPPPYPVYGPPPRSHKLIEEQAIITIEKGKDIVNVHAFDPAIFPLATVPLYNNNTIIGSVWVRVHIERELPLTKLKRVVNFVTIISVVGFVVMAMFSFFLRNGIRNIRKELDNTGRNTSYRLKTRGGWFGFIPASINEMLATLERENNDRKLLQKQLQQEEKLASLGKMIAGVAHEVKTPLAVIKMRVQMWEKEIKNNPSLQKQISPESMTLVLDEINRLSSLVKRLVVFSRPIQKNFKPIDIKPLIEEVTGMVDISIDHKNISIEKSFGKEIPLVSADSNTIKQVLINVLNNSIESIREKGMITINTSYFQEKDMVEIDICDTGEGIPDEILDKIFDPFFTSKDTGTGLGLSISHEIITAHKGSISFSKNDPLGIKCSILLPVHQKSVENGS